MRQNMSDAGATNLGDCPEVGTELHSIREGVALSEGQNPAPLVEGYRKDNASKALDALSQIPHLARMA